MVSLFHQANRGAARERLLRIEELARLSSYERGLFSIFLNRFGGCGWAAWSYLAQVAGNFLRAQSTVQQSENVAGERRTNAIAWPTLQGQSQPANGLLVMILDGPDAQAKSVRDFLVGQAVCLQPQNLPLPWSENATPIGNIRNPAHRILLSTLPRDFTCSDVTEQEDDP